MPDVKLWTKREVAAFYRVSEKTVGDWMAQGRIEYITTPGNHPRFLPPTVEPTRREAPPVG